MPLEKLTSEVQIFYLARHEDKLFDALSLDSSDVMELDTEVFEGKTALIDCGSIDKLARNDFMLGKLRGARKSPITDWHSHDIYIGPRYVGRYGFTEGIVIMDDVVDNIEDNIRLAHYLPQTKIISGNINDAIDRLWTELGYRRKSRPFVFYHGFPNGLSNGFP